MLRIVLNTLVCLLQGLAFGSANRCKRLLQFSLRNFKLAGAADFKPVKLPRIGQQRAVALPAYLRNNFLYALTDIRLMLITRL